MRGSLSATDGVGQDELKRKLLSADNYPEHLSTSCTMIIIHQRGKFQNVNCSCFMDVVVEAAR